ncbi:YfhO family protein [bacterium]|nr:YfhO family protein [bacterium]
MAKPNLKLKTDKGQTTPVLNSWQKDALAVLFLYALVLFLFSDYVLQNKVFTTGGDISASISNSRAAQSLIEKEGSMPLWFPYTFSGMPNFASGMYSDPAHIPIYKYQAYVNPMTYVNWAVNIAFFNRDNSWEVAIFFFAGVFMFLLARQLGFSPLIALVAAIAYMFCNFFVASVAAGHGGKVKTIAYIPLVMWSVFRFFKDRNILNWSIMGFIMGTFFLDPGHTQIIYYAFLMLGIYFVFLIIDKYRTDKAGLIKNGFGLAAAMLVGLAFGAVNYFSLYVYSDVTMRAVPPALSESTAMAAGGGMTFDYITMWSFHPLESITFFIPTFFGLESPYYWGWMTFTSSAFYFGLLPMIAAIVGVIYRRNMMTKFLFATSVFALLISFGRFFEPLFQLMLSVLPFFSKFRVPSMILSIFAFTVSLLACYGLDYIFNPTAEEQKKRKTFEKAVLYFMAGIGVLLIIATIFKSGFSNAFSLLAEDDVKRYSAPQIAQLKQLRFDALSGGFVKFAIMLEIILSMIYFYLREKISYSIAMSVLLIVLVFDTLSLNKKILRPQARAGMTYEFQETETIRFLRSDTTNFRIFSLLEHAQSGSPVWTYYGLQSVGGYSPAKMRIYQDIIDFALYKGADPQFPVNMNVVNMLNVKYLIANGQLPQGKGFFLSKLDEANKTLIYENKNRLPRAFFVKQIVVEADKPAIFGLLNSESFNPAETVILEKKPHLAVEPFDSSSAEITEFTTDRITVKAYVDKPSQLVLSEVYYPHGWKAFVDGQETEIFKSNYVLRSVQVPPGEHVIEFRFEPAEFRLGIWVTAISFYSVTGIMIISIISVVIKRRKEVQG